MAKKKEEPKARETVVEPTNVVLDENPPKKPETVSEFYELFANMKRAFGEYETEAEAAKNWPPFGMLRAVTQQNYLEAVAHVKVSGEARTEFEQFVLESLS